MGEVKKDVVGGMRVGDRTSGLCVRRIVRVVAYEHVCVVRIGIVS